MSCASTVLGIIFIVVALVFAVSQVVRLVSDIRAKHNSKKDTDDPSGDSPRKGS